MTNLEILKCPFCFKECKNPNSLRQHSVRCKLNPNRKRNPTSIGGSEYKATAWNKGLTKSSDERLARKSAIMSENMRSGKIAKPVNPPKTKEAREHLSKLAIERKLGGVRQSKRIEYNGVKLGSTYEVELAKSLDLHNIQWRIPNRLTYTDHTGKQRSYTADFFLPDYNVYLDPKNDFLIENVNPSLGFKDCDKIKWVEDQNNVRVIILNKSQLSWTAVMELL